MVDRYLLKIKKDGYSIGIPNRTVNFCFYYTIKRKQLLIKFQNLFELAKQKFTEERRNSIWDFIESIWDRYEYMLFNKDQIEEIHNKTRIDNDSQFLIENFMYNFIIITYSNLDSLAWIIHHWYSLNLKREEITLNFSRKTKFIKAIESKNKKLADLLKRKSVQDWINYLQDYRDYIQHRQKVHIIPEEGRNYKRMVIEMKPGMCQHYPNLEYDKYEDIHFQVYNKFGRSFEPVKDFCKKNLDELTLLIENVSKCIKTGH